MTPAWYNKTTAQWQDFATQVNETANGILEAALASASSYDEIVKSSETLTTCWNATSIIHNTKSNATDSDVVLSINAANWVYSTLSMYVLQWRATLSETLADLSTWD
jgi:hypothetical protein